MNFVPLPRLVFPTWRTFCRRNKSPVDKPFFQGQLAAIPKIFGQCDHEIFEDSYLSQS